MGQRKGPAVASILVMVGFRFTLVILALPVVVLSQPRPLITSRIDETRLHTLTSNTRPEANAQNDLGAVADRSEERRVGKECRSRWWPDQAEDGIRDA